MKRVMVFGVFDGLHEGHRAFLREAKSCGDYLIAVVTQDHTAEMLKGKKPKHDLAERIDGLKQTNHADEVIVGDSALGSWQVLEKYKPDIIALGYDQIAPKKELERYFEKVKWRPELKVMKRYEPNIYRSSLLN